MINLKVIKIEDENYPNLLRKIENPPKQLYAKGNVELLNTHIIAIIGSRACSENGKKLANKFSKDLVYQGLTIASGMARGIDTEAHQATLKKNGKTIAVLGNGFKYIFPKENIELYQEIIKSGGLVVTEYPPEEKPKSQNFLERNRIVSGIALGILVIEAAYRSGTSVTATLAKEQGRKIFTLPHEIGDKHGTGTNRLIQKGAKLITKVEDIMEEFSFLPYTEPVQEEQESTNRRICNKQEYNEIYQYITDKPILLNEIYRKSKRSINEINNILLMLELEGYIQKVAGGYVCILEKK